MLVFSNRIPLPRRAPRRATRHQMRRRLREYQGEQRRAPRRRCITNRFARSRHRPRCRGQTSMCHPPTSHRATRSRCSYRQHRSSCASQWPRQQRQQQQRTQLPFFVTLLLPFEKIKGTLGGGWRDVVRVWVGGCDSRPPTLVSVFPNVFFRMCSFHNETSDTFSKRLVDYLVNIH